MSSEISSVDMPVCTRSPLTALSLCVNRTILLLGLWDVRNSVIGDERVRGISGGQRKRVNIGMELVTNPAVIFLGNDRPTTVSCSMQ